MSHGERVETDRKYNQGNNIMTDADRVIAGIVAGRIRGYMKMDYNDWLEKFRPHLDNGDIKQYQSVDDLKEVGVLPQAGTPEERLAFQSPHHKRGGFWGGCFGKLWTMVVSGDDWSIANGYHYVNKMYFIVTEVPCPEGVQIDVDY